MCSWILTPVHAAEVTLEQVVARHTEAVGGREAVERVRSVQYALTIVEPTFTVDGIYRADRKLRMRIDVVADGKRVCTEAYDGRAAWEMGGDGVDGVLRSFKSVEVEVESGAVAQTTTVKEVVANPALDDAVFR